ncbi:acylated pleckstrin-homology domain-containing protein [Babesia caballi]|uniref:Acylated pleckstrin-homology domain-containing protein n=1 Tax=Babesia caballi TaxID=5871 RepID=A0AAV4LTQ7_BABCB|nr:acylated pleckstrin-homology domain-containing protein [Babesia caballi]
MSTYTGSVRRTPDGPLLSALIFNTNELTYRELTKWNLDSAVFGFNEDLIKDKAKVTVVAHSKTQKNVESAPVRANRRRPTYSAKCLKAVSDEESVESSSDTNDETATSKDIRQNKILQYRKALTKIVKVKTAIFHEKVRVTCSKDGKCIEWYKVKAAEDEENKRQLIGTLPVSKITNFKTKVDNVRYLEISAGNNGYLFMFKTGDEREQWQSDFDSFLKFMKMI